VDLENGFSDDPTESAKSLLRAAEAGAVGGSIEDATGRPDAPIYCFEHAVARIEAAVAAVRTLPFPFILTARAENYLHGNPDLDDTIRRLKAFADAGADVLYAPGLRNAEEVLAVVRAVAPKPVNVLMSGGLKLTVQELQDMGVRRISTGSALALAAFGEFFRAAEEIQQSGTFGFTSQSMPYGKANQFFKG
jgi:2-methylisocitrate lyase-like PEP mutase family enzyme